MELPRFFALKLEDVGKYVRYVKGVESGADMECTGEEVVSPYTKFEAEMPADTDSNDQGLVHIRCCYNNKYWVKFDDNNEDRIRICPRATTPEEDKHNVSCTLFEPIFNSVGQVKFRHVQLDQQLFIYAACRNILKVHPYHEGSYFDVVNWQSLMVLPKYVAFKKPDGQYLNVPTDDHYRLEYKSDDAGVPTVGQEIITNEDGSIRLRFTCTNNIWRRDADNWIRASSGDNSGDYSFQPIKVADNIIALRCLGNNNYCRSVKDGDYYYLKADVSTISRDTHLEVEELVLSRSIYNVKFRKTDGRIYDETEITVASGEVVNRTNVDDTIELKLSYEDTHSHSWNFSGSLTLGVKYDLKSGVPIICESGIEFSASITLGLQYTTTTSTTRLAETVYRVNVPANTCVNVSLKATKGRCDVPYSYTQCDTLYNGKTETYRKDDGVFSGTNAYGLRYETSQKAL